MRSWTILYLTLTALLGVTGCKKQRPQPTRPTRDIQQRRPRTPLHVAASDGNVEAIRRLLEEGADEDEDGQDGKESADDGERCGVAVSMLFVVVVRHEKNP